MIVSPTNQDAKSRNRIQPTQVSESSFNAQALQSKSHVVAVDDSVLTVET